MPFARFLLRNYDLGLVEHLGGQLVNVSNENFKDVRVRQMYMVAVDGIVNVGAGYGLDIYDVRSGLQGSDNLVPIYLTQGEPVYNQFKVPSYVISRLSMSPAFDFNIPFYEYRSRVADDANLVQVRFPNRVNEKGFVVDDIREGYDKVEYIARGEPVRIDYELRIFGRTRTELQILLYYAMRRFWGPSFHFKVRGYSNDGSVEEERYYTGVDVSYSDASEFNDITDATMVNIISFSVIAELDIWEEKVADHIITTVDRDIDIKED